jgi:hypothetical protein
LGEALAFARKNQLPLYVSGWCRPHFRNWLRHGDLRWYWGFFEPWHEVSLLHRLPGSFIGQIVSNPPVETPIEPAIKNVIFEFSKVPHWSQYFAQIAPYRTLILDEFLRHISPKIMGEASSLPSPVVCIQVRLGDFQHLKQGEQFAKTGLTRTPMEYYLNFVESIRAISGPKTPVTIVSDGAASDLAPLLKLPYVTHHPGRSALTDLLLMSKSQLLITAAGSTYGQWAGFIGNPILLHHPEHHHSNCRPISSDSAPFEGAVWPDTPNAWPHLLTDAVTRLNFAH